MTATEPGKTIYGPGWKAARKRLAAADPDETDALLASAMDRVESAWPAVRDLTRWVQLNREWERADDEYACLLTFIEWELCEAFRSMAFALAEVAATWPESEKASPDDVIGGLSAFVRYVPVLVLATTSAKAPLDFRELVRAVSPLGRRGEWSRQLSGILSAVADRSAAAADAKDALAAVQVLTHAIPEAERDGASATLLSSLEPWYAPPAGPPPPEWLVLLRRYFAGHAPDGGA